MDKENIQYKTYPFDKKRTFLSFLTCFRICYFSAKESIDPEINSG